MIKRPVIRGKVDDKKASDQVRKRIIRPVIRGKEDDNN
jgi:hypothetical protein